MTLTLPTTLQQLTHVSYEALDYLLDVMPNVRSLSLAFDARQDNLFRYLPLYLEPLREITRLDMEYLGASSEEFIAVMRACSKSLMELRTYCAWLTHDHCSAIGACTKLRSLELKGRSDPLDDDQLRMILVGLRNLKTLVVVPWLTLTEENLSIILKMEKLERLHLCAKTSFSHTFMRSLGKRTRFPPFEA